MTGTLTVVGSNNDYVTAITLSNYSDAATGYTVNGTLNFSLSMAPSGASGTTAGDVALSGGQVTTATFGSSFTTTGPTVIPAYTGTITCNGTSFDAHTLLEGYAKAEVAQQIVVNGIGAVLNSLASVPSPKFAHIGVRSSQGSSLP
jgi:hypothetical protein